MVNREGLKHTLQERRAGSANLKAISLHPDANQEIHNSPNSQNVPGGTQVNRPIKLFMPLFHEPFASCRYSYLETGSRNGYMRLLCRFAVQRAFAED